MDKWMDWQIINSFQVLGRGTPSFHHSSVFSRMSLFLVLWGCGTDYFSGILYIDATTNTLNRHYGTEGSQQIISDLRGCRVDKVYTEDGRTVLDIRLSTASTSDSTIPE